MTWVKLADDFYDHPKVLASGPLAGWLWVCGIAYANRYLTDGYLTAAAVRRLTDLDDPFRLAARLVDVGLWRTIDGGYAIHDYEKYQPTASVVKKEREANTERVRKWREKMGGNGVTEPSGNGVTNGRSNGAPGPARPGPVTVPDPAGTTSPQPPPQAEGERAQGQRRGSAVDRQDAELTPATPDDVAVWQLALADAASVMSPGNAQLVGALVPVGRGSDGALRLRAPPGMPGLARFRAHVAKALLDAGDAAGPRVVIVGSGGEQARSPSSMEDA